MTDIPQGTDSSVVCVLAERSYFHGVAALANSLVHGGFHGRIMVGYRGNLPAWAAAATTAPIAPGVTMEFVLVGAGPDGVGWHLGNMKPHFLRRIAIEFCPDADVLYYFDVDIVIGCAWENYLRWAQSGVLAVLDMAETAMPPNHVYRVAWRALAERAGFACRDVTGYCNSGCLGMSRAYLPFLDVWARLLEQLAAEGTDMARLTAHSGQPEFAKMDQDMLNVALMASDVPLAVLGREAMGCWPYSGVMFHAMVSEKPWLRRYVRDALNGFPPDVAHQAFWRHTYGPIHSFTASELLIKRMMYRLARSIGVFRRRPVAYW